MMFTTIIILFIISIPFIAMFGGALVAKDRREEQDNIRAIKTMMEENNN